MVIPSTVIYASFTVIKVTSYAGCRCNFCVRSEYYSRQPVQLLAHQAISEYQMKSSHQALIDLIEKYNTSGPRYTSYPTALQFKDSFNVSEHLSDMNIEASKPLSLYIHIPFCHQLCFYCGCNKIVTRHQSKADIYLDYLSKEIRLYSSKFRHRTLRHLHLGGGTPTFLTIAQMSSLISLIKDSFNFDDCSVSEWSIEIDPRSVDETYLNKLKELGFNRLSFGLQDFDFDVQTAINRVQDFSDIKRLFSISRELGFKSINADMIYGLPLQSAKRFNTSIHRLLELSPDRVSVFNYAHLPTKFAAQRKIKESDLPSPSEKIEIFTDTIETLIKNGYQYIGIDHFAKKDDSLARAQNANSLHRNFQGYTTHRDTDLIGVGVSAIGQLGNVMMQNPKELRRYYEKLDTSACEDLISECGYVSNSDDNYRALLIRELMCHYEINFTYLNKTLEEDIKIYFERELKQLDSFVNDGILAIDHNGYKVTEIGKFFIRNIAMIFDRYLPKQIKFNQFSRVI